MAENKNIYQKLSELQAELKAPKNLTNAFGNYKYRSAEGILNAAKPLLTKHKLLLTISDKIIEVGERIYVEAHVRLKNIEKIGEEITIEASARESLVKKGMDESQITGATSSYARKYALNGLFAIDDVKDADHDAPPKEDDKSKAVEKKDMTMKQYEGVMKALEDANEKRVADIKKKMGKYDEKGRYLKLAMKGIANKESHLSKQPSEK